MLLLRFELIFPNFNKYIYSEWVLNTPLKSSQPIFCQYFHLPAEYWKRLKLQSWLEHCTKDCVKHSYLIYFPGVNILWKCIVENCAFPQNFYIWKLGAISVFSAELKPKQWIFYNPKKLNMTISQFFPLF